MFTNDQSCQVFVFLQSQTDKMKQGRNILNIYWFYFLSMIWIYTVSNTDVCFPALFLQNI